MPSPLKPGPDIQSVVGTATLEHHGSWRGGKDLARTWRQLFTGDSRSVKAGRVNECVGGGVRGGRDRFFFPFLTQTCEVSAAQRLGGFRRDWAGGWVNPVSTQQLVDIPHPFRDVDLPLPSRWEGAKPMSTCKTRQWAGGCTRLVFGMLTDCELMGANAKKVCVGVCACFSVCVGG